VQLVEQGVLVVDDLEGDVTMPDVQLVVVGVEGDFTMLEVQLVVLVMVVDGQPGSVNEGVV
jgi:hypothetical protein